MWPKFCVALVTRYDLFSEENLEPLSYLFLFWIYRHYTPVALLLCCDNIKDWFILPYGLPHIDRQIVGQTSIFSENSGSKHSKNCNVYIAKIILDIPPLYTSCFVAML